MKVRNSISKLLVVFALSLFALAACGQPTETPEQVLQNFKQKVTEIKSADISGKVSMKASDNEGMMDFTSDADFKFDRRDMEDRKTDVTVSMSGVMKVAENAFDGDLDLNLRTLNGDYYIRIDKLDSSSENMQAVRPVFENYIGKWLRISEDFIPENIRQIEQKDEETLAKEKQLKQLFVDTNLFIVAKEYGVENVNGHKVYHYGIQFDENGVKEYVQKAAVIDGRELTDEEIEEASKIVSYVDNAELWIGTDDYYLYKAILNLVGGYQEEDGTDMNIDVLFTGNDYNKAIKVSAPDGAEEFNPLELIMAYSAATMAVSEETDVVMEEVTEE